MVLSAGSGIIRFIGGGNYEKVRIRNQLAITKLKYVTNQSFHLPFALEL